jgi:quercetin dioxygenase-like cupin family protein
LVNPYFDSGDCRLFLAWANDEQFVWHRDEEDRKITVLSGEGWCFQYEDCLPFVLKRGSVFEIPKNEYHRLLKGTTDLLVRITKTNK